MRPVDPRRLAMAFASRKQFQPVLTLDGEAFKLPHLVRQRSLEEVVFDVQREAFAMGFQIRGIGRQFSVRVAVEDQAGLPLVRGRLGHEQHLGEPLLAPSHLAMRLARNLDEPAVRRNAGHANLPGKRRRLIRRAADEHFHRLGWPLQSHGIVQVQGFAVLPPGRPAAPRGRQRCHFFTLRCRHHGHAGTLLLQLRLHGRATKGMRQSPRQPEVLLLPGRLQHPHLRLEAVRSLPIRGFTHKLV